MMKRFHKPENALRRAQGTFVVSLHWQAAERGWLWCRGGGCVRVCSVGERIVLLGSFICLPVIKALWWHCDARWYCALTPCCGLCRSLSSELIGVGKKKNAMDLLHRQFTTPRFRQWQQAYEDLMIQFFDLCVELREIRKLKDGLHHYRNSAQQAAPSSLETVIKHLLHTAEKRAYAARDAAEGQEARALHNLDDLEEGESPEAIMLSTVTSENAAERKSSSMVVPWTRFLWELYRGVLENLKSSPKMERVYHSTARKAFQFCIDFNRKTELRRVASILRHHLINATKAATVEGWTQESMEEHMSTRFVQLDTATQLELWHEAFRTVEDIHTLIEASQKQPRAQLMAEYFEKLTQIFWVAENYLFHAYAWFSFYSLSVSQNRALSAAERQFMASRVLLATLCVPLHEDSQQSAAFDVDAEGDRRSRLAELLQFPSTPSRAGLLADIRSNNVLALAHPVAVELFNTLEEDFRPLSAVKTAVPLFVSLANMQRLREYVPPLERLLLHRLVRELSAVYRTVRISYFRKLINGLFLAPRSVATPYGQGFLTSIRDDGTFVFSVPFGHMFSHDRFALQDPAETYLRAEGMLVRAAKARHLHVRVDHANQVLRLGHDALDNAQMSRHLTRLATGLQGLCAVINPVSAETALARRVARFGAAADSMVDSHVAIKQRQELIERRKEEFERLQKDKQKKAKALKAAAMAKARLREAESRARVREAQEATRKRKEEAEKARVSALQQLKALGEDVSNMVDDPTSDPVGRLKEVQKRMDKEQAEAEAKARSAAKQLDFLTRATREAEWKRLKVRRRELRARERAAHEEAQRAARAEAQAEHDKHMAIRARLAALKPFTDAFRAKLVQSTLEEREAERQRQQEELEERVMNRLYRARRKKQRREQEEREAAEEEARRRAAEEAEARRHAEEAARRAVAEAERKRRAEEEEAERQRRAERPRDRSPPRTSRFGGGSGGAAGGGGGRYAPPARRAGGGGGGFSDRYDRDSRDSRYGGRDSRDSRYGRDSRDSYRDSRDSRDSYSRGGRDSRDSQESGGRRFGNSRLFARSGGGSDEPYRPRGRRDGDRDRDGGGERSGRFSFRS